MTTELDDKLKERTHRRLVNALNQFKRELAAEGVDTTPLTLEYIVKLLADYVPPAPVVVSEPEIVEPESLPPGIEEVEEEDVTAGSSTNWRPPRKSKKV